jgi:hypothetical protein
MFDSLNSGFAKGGVTLARWASVAAVGAFTISAAHAGLSASISSPSNSSVYPSGTTSVSASFSASDNTSGRIIASFSATLDGSSVSFSSPGPSGMGTQSVTASANLTVSNGQHTVVLTAEDQYGTQATATSTFNVGKLTQAAVSTQNASNININTSWSPYEQGGSGSGGWQFCISGATNWDGGVSSRTGTNWGTSQSPNWQPTWTTAQVRGSDNLTFYVVRDGDSNYNPSSYASGSLTLNAPVPALTWQSINYGYGTYQGTAGTTGSFPISAYTSGTATWDNNYYMVMFDQNNNAVDDVPTGNVSPGGTASGTVSFTLPSTPGSYTYHFSGMEQGVEYFGSQPTISVTAMGYQYPQISGAQTVYLQASNSITLYASGGQTNYQWSTSQGSLSPTTGGSTTITFSSPGQVSVQVYCPASTYYYAASSSYATFNVVNGYPPPVVSYGSPTGTYGTAFSYQVSASNSPTSFSASNLPPGLSINNSGLISGFPTATGHYSATVYANNSNGQGSNTIAITVGQAGQSAVVIEPAGPLNAANGQTITFSATGGSGTGNYVWGGAASGTGSMATVTFSTNGTQTVTVYRAADSNYLQSSPASVSITVATGVPDNGNSTQLNVLVPTSTP